MSKIHDLKVSGFSTRQSKIVADSYGGWEEAYADTLTLSSATSNPTTYICNYTDANLKFQVGDKIRLTQNASVKYFYVVAVTSTTVTLCAGSDYVIANTTTYPISALAYSRVERPWGFPAYFNYVPTWTSTGTQPVLNNGTINGTFVMRGNEVIAHTSLAMGGTTTFGSGTYQFGYPVTVVDDVKLITGGIASLWRGAVILGGTRRYSTTTFAVMTNSGYVTATSPGTWASGDGIHCAIGALL